MMTRTAIYAWTREQADEAIEQLDLCGLATVLTPSMPQGIRGRTIDRLILVGDAQLGDRERQEIAPALLARGRGEVFRWRSEAL